MFHKRIFWFIGHSKKEINEDDVSLCDDFDVRTLDLKRRIIWTC
jgi:hypothetical protein